MAHKSLLFSAKCSFLSLKPKCQKSHFLHTFCAPISANAKKWKNFFFTENGAQLVRHSLQKNAVFFGKFPSQEGVPKFRPFLARNSWLHPAFKTIAENGAQKPRHIRNANLNPASFLCREWRTKLPLKLRSVPFFLHFSLPGSEKFSPSWLGNEKF